MQTLTRKKILSYSSGWVGVVLNLLPGLGTGYIYQRRWTAYWLTILFSIICTGIGLYKDLSIDPSDPVLIQQDSIDFWGLIAITIITAIEAGFKAKDAKNKL